MIKMRNSLFLKIMIPALVFILAVCYWCLYSGLVEPNTEAPVNENNPSSKPLTAQEFLARQNNTGNSSSKTPNQPTREQVLQKRMLQMQSRALIAARYDSPEDFIKKHTSYLKNEAVEYPEVAAVVKPEHLPLLYSMLQDPAQAPYYHNIARMIGYVGHDETSADVLWNYFQRDGDWSDDSYSISKSMKIYILAFLGRIGAEKYDALLRKATTSEGALEIAANWINSPFILDKNIGYHSQADVVKNIRSAALEGLVYSQRPENIEFVRQLYQKEYDEVVALNKLTPMFPALSSTMAYQDYIAEYGLPLYSFIQSEVNILWPELEPYFKKYSWRMKETDKQ